MNTQKKSRVAAAIVTFRNPQEEVICAAKSILHSKVAVQLTIIDNCSGNGLFDKLRESLPCDFIQTERNGGFGYAHNIGLRHASGSDYYLVANPDVIVHPGTLQSMVEYMDQHPEIGLLCPKILNEDGSCQKLNKRNPTVIDFFLRRFFPGWAQLLPRIKKRMDYYVMDDCGYDTPYDVPYVSGCFMLFRRDVLERVGGFDEGFFMYLEDADITRRVREKTRAVFYPQAVITHKWARGSHRSFRLTLVTVHSAIYYFNKWGWKWW
jgi:GT2 family glycosyltransferase